MTQMDIERFIWKNIICHFGISHFIVTDNSQQFMGKALHKIWHQATLSDKKGKCPDELPGVLWAYPTTKRRATGKTSFSLAYGYEAIIHPNFVMPSINTVLPNLEQNENEMATNLDLAEEKHDKVISGLSIAAHLQLQQEGKNPVVPPGDLVIRKAFITA
ncbi:uncharacterized protein [Pyrus communis]|uniref:uncharacterized protein n=1 Tax=Pyrus communis TaxID=23211 RepID=UPI0035BEEC3B